MGGRNGDSLEHNSTLTMFSMKHFALALTLNPSSKRPGIQDPAQSTSTLLSAFGPWTPDWLFLGHFPPASPENELLEQLDPPLAGMEEGEKIPKCPGVIFFFLLACPSLVLGYRPLESIDTRMMIIISNIY